MEMEIPPHPEEPGQDPQEDFSRQLLVEACLAVARDMENYDYQIGRLVRKVRTAVTENPTWAGDESHLLRLIRQSYPLCAAEVPLACGP